MNTPVNTKVNEATLRRWLADAGANEAQVDEALIAYKAGGVSASRVVQDTVRKLTKSPMTKPSPRAMSKA